jgi:CheY-like chemotaxis protein
MANGGMRHKSMIGRLSHKNKVGSRTAATGIRVNNNIKSVPVTKKRLLFVDDDEALVQVVASFFCRHGYEVETASEAEEAVAMVKHRRFAIVITDLELNSIEGLDGFSVLRAMAQFCCATKVLVYSSYSNEAVVEAAIQQGGNKFVAKPASLRELLKSAEELWLTC